MQALAAIAFRSINWALDDGASAFPATTLLASAPEGRFTGAAPFSHAQLSAIAALPEYVFGAYYVPVNVAIAPAPASQSIALSSDAKQAVAAALVAQFSPGTHATTTRSAPITPICGRCHAVEAF